jgi:twitching motility protein PilI
MGPFETLLDIERDCKAYAINIPRQIISEKDWFGIGFKSSGYNFVCPMYEISEVLIWPSITEVPGAHPWFKGVANLRGRMLPVTDVEGFVIGKPHSESDDSRVLVTAFEGNLYGFAVAQVLGIERFFGAEKRAMEKFEEVKAYLPYAQGIFEREHRPWVILSFQDMIKATEFYHVISLKVESA